MQIVINLNVRFVRRVAVVILSCLAMAALIVPAVVYSSNVNLPHAFSNGNVADADEVNANFTATRDGINDNHTKIVALDTRAGSLENRIASLESDVAGLETQPKSNTQFAEAETSIILTRSWQTVLQVSINAPSRGTAHVIANASFHLGADTGNPALLGISLAENQDPTHILAHLDHYELDTGATIPATTQLVTSVGPGARTFYLVATRAIDTGGTIELSRPQMSVMFVPE